MSIALVGAGLLVGLLLGRFLFVPAPAGRPGGGALSAALPGDSAAPAAPGGASAGNAKGPEHVSLGDPAAARQSLEVILATADPRQRARAFRAYIDSLRATEFAEALKRLRLIANSNERDLATRLLAAQWVLTDPEGALQFAAGNRGYEYLATDVFRERAASDFDGAVRHARDIPGNDLRYAALLGVLQQKADRDPTAALQLAQSFGEFRGKEPLTNAIYRQWAKADPAAAGAYATQDGQGSGWRSPINQVASTWADQDPLAAAQWALSLGDAEARRRSVSEVMRHWSRDEPAAAANWIHSLEVGALRDSAVAGFAASIAWSDPQTALGWIGTMSDENERQRILRRVGRTVLWRDPANGPAMLEKAGLAADQIESLRRGRRGGDW